MMSFFRCCCLIALTASTAIAQESDQQPTTQPVRLQLAAPASQPATTSPEQGSKDVRPDGIVLLEKAKNRLHIRDDQEARYNELAAKYRKLMRENTPDAAVVADLERRLEEAQAQRARPVARVLRGKLLRLHAQSDLLAAFIEELEPILDARQTARANRLRRSVGDERPELYRRLGKAHDYKDKLKLNEDQVAEFDALVDSVVAQLAPANDGIRPPSSRLLEIAEEMRIASEAGDNERMAQLRGRVEMFESKPEAALRRLRFEARDMLTAEQMEKLTELLQEFKGFETDVPPLRRIIRIAMKLDLNKFQKQEISNLRIACFSEQQTYALNRVLRDDIARDALAEINFLLDDEQRAKYAEMLVKEPRE